MADEVKESIKTQIVDGIRRVSGDSGSTEMHNLSDQVEAAKFASSSEAARSRQAGIRLMRFKPGGAP